MACLPAGTVESEKTCEPRSASRQQALPFFGTIKTMIASKTQIESLLSQMCPIFRKKERKEGRMNE